MANSKILTWLVGTIAIILFFCFAVQSQNAKERTLLISPWKNEPAKIIQIESAHGPLKSGKVAVRDEKWLQGLSVRVKNTSDKTIVSLIYVLTLYGDGKSGQNPIGTELRYGEFGSENSGNTPVPPGGEVVIFLSEDKFADLSKVVRARKKTMDDVIKARLILQMVCFDDHTCWIGGNIVPAESLAPTQSIDQSTQQHSIRPHRINPQMDFCGAVMSQYRILCCDCSGSADTYCRRYMLRLARPGETRVFICTFACTCSCPEPDNFTQECTGHTLEPCSDYIGICGGF
jgi:hypothetical protein